MTPSRRAVLAAGAAALLAPRAPAAARGYALAPKRVADGLWMVEGLTEYFSLENGGNIVNVCFFETEAGAVLVDTGPSRLYGEALRAAMAQAVPAGVAAVIVTHHHPDHWFGNQVFADRPILALGATRAAAQAEGSGFADNMYRLVGDWMRGTEPVPPTEALAGGRFEIGGRAFEALPLGGHTGADLALIDPRSGVLVAGDLAFLNRAPTTPHADLARWRQSLDLLAGTEAAALLPGHGPFDRAGDALRQTRAYLDWLETTLRAAAESGLSEAEALGLPLPPEFAAMGAQPQEFARSVAHLYPDFELAALPRVD